MKLSFEWDGLTLAGSLHLPSEGQPHPCVVMAQGSGPADRDSGGYFVPIRQTFIDRGVAAFAFDKPGCGESSGDWRRYSLEDRAQQTAAAIELVRNHPAIDSARMGLFGHSQGGWLVQKLAGRLEGLAFAIASAAPTMCVKEQILHECDQSMRDHGFGLQQTQDALDLTQALLDAAAAGADFESISDRLLEPARRQPWYDTFPTIDDAGEWLHVQALVGEPHDPLSDLEGVSCPFLAIFGGLDHLLPPCRCAEESRRAFAGAENSDVTVVLFPAGTHRIQKPDTEDFVDGYLDLLGRWAEDRAD